MRSRTGDVYDQVVLIGTDERRDVAALKIMARDLPTLPPGSAGYVKAGNRPLLFQLPTGSARSQR